MSSAEEQKPARRFPLPCWTQDEALELIGAYRERWYAFKRAFLRTADWDAVAEKVTTAYPDVTPPKTSAQCRHKMEKLRQRYRAEKQRATAFSGGRFISTWFYYEAMEAVENGYNTEPGSLNPNPGIRVKPSVVQKFATIAPNFTKRRSKPNPNFANFGSKVSIEEEDYDVRSLAESPIEETLIPKNDKKFSIEGGIRIKPSITPQVEPGRFDLRPRKFSKVVDGDEDDDNGEMWIKVPSRRGKWGKKNSWKLNGRKGKKKNNGGIGDVVASIKLLGEGFMKVEKMKIDMVKEIEEMRMEAEMKRNRLMLESQKQIVDAFVQGLIECRKVSTTMADHL